MMKREDGSKLMMNKDTADRGLNDFIMQAKRELGNLTAEEYIAKNPGKHIWCTYQGFESCALCGVNRRDASPGLTCKGTLLVKLRKAIRGTQTRPVATAQRLLADGAVVSITLSRLVNKERLK